MNMQEERGTAEPDDIAELARQYLLEPGTLGLQRIEEQINRAMADSRWDDIGKWHRVRYRLIRLQQEREIAERLAGDSAGG